MHYLALQIVCVRIKMESFSRLSLRWQKGTLWGFPLIRFHFTWNIKLVPLSLLLVPLSLDPIACTLVPGSWTLRPQAWSLNPWPQAFPQSWPCLKTCDLLDPWTTKKYPGLPSHTTDNGSTIWSLCLYFELACSSSRYARRPMLSWNASVQWSPAQ